MDATTLTTTAIIGTFLFWALFAFRYLRTIVSVYTFCTYKPKPMADNPRYTSADASVIIPTTFKTPEELMHCVSRILLCNPAAIYIVTANANVSHVYVCLGAHALDKDTDKIKVLGVDKLNKRTQILKAMAYVETPITILADDDVFWPEKFTDYMLAIFEDPEVGAGGPRQRVRRNDSVGLWNFLGISYLERRVWNNCATNAIDGSISTLSGRTALYRTGILKSDEFEYYFTHDTWRGKPLNSDDDKCLTRYVYSHGWKIVLQFDARATIETTVEPDSGYLHQCMRWCRAHWRGNFIVMQNESYWCSLNFWWGFYYIYLGQFQTPALLIDGLLALFLWMAVIDSASAKNAYIALASWIFFTKNLKMIPHFWRHPIDMIWIPFGIAFSYIHGVLNVYAAFSMQQTHWGSQNLIALAENSIEKEVEAALLLAAITDSRVEKEQGEVRLLPTAMAEPEIEKKEDKVPLLKLSIEQVSVTLEDSIEQAEGRCEPPPAGRTMFGGDYFTLKDKEGKPVEPSSHSQGGSAVEASVDSRDDSAAEASVDSRDDSAAEASVDAYDSAVELSPISSPKLAART